MKHQQYVDVFRMESGKSAIVNVPIATSERTVILEQPGKYRVSLLVPQPIVVIVARKRSDNRILTDQAAATVTNLDWQDCLVFSGSFSRVFSVGRQCAKVGLSFRTSDTLNTQQLLLEYLGDEEYECE